MGDPFKKQHGKEMWVPRAPRRGASLLVGFDRGGHVHDHERARHVRMSAGQVPMPIHARLSDRMATRVSAL